MGSIIYLYRPRITRRLLLAASDIAEARLEAALIPGDIGRNDTVGLLQQMVWRQVMWATPKYYAEILRTLRFIGHTFLCEFFITTAPLIWAKPNAQSRGLCKVFMVRARRCASSRREICLQLV
jgi:hypothetical protein